MPGGGNRRSQAQILSAVEGSRRRRDWVEPSNCGENVGPFGSPPLDCLSVVPGTRRGRLRRSFRCWPESALLPNSFRDYDEATGAVDLFDDRVVRGADGRRSLG